MHWCIVFRQWRLFKQSWNRHSICRLPIAGRVTLFLSPNGKSCSGYGGTPFQPSIPIELPLLIANVSACLTLPVIRYGTLIAVRYGFGAYSQWKRLAASQIRIPSPIHVQLRYGVRNVNFRQESRQTSLARENVESRCNLQPLFRTVFSGVP